MPESIRAATGGFYRGEPAVRHSRGSRPGPREGGGGNPELAACAAALRAAVWVPTYAFAPHAGMTAFFTYMLV